MPFTTRCLRNQPSRRSRPRSDPAPQHFRFHRAFLRLDLLKSQSSSLFYDTTDEQADLNRSIIQGKSTLCPGESCLSPPSICLILWRQWTSFCQFNETHRHFGLCGQLLSSGSVPLATLGTKQLRGGVEMSLEHFFFPSVSSLIFRLVYARSVFSLADIPTSSTAASATRVHSTRLHLLCHACVRSGRHRSQ